MSINFLHFAVAYHSSLFFYAAVVRGWFNWSARVEMVEKLNSFDWTSNAKTSLCELGPQLRQWSNVVSAQNPLVNHKFTN